MKLSPIEILNALATLILAGLIAWAKWQERKANAREKRMRQEAGLPDNPTSCRDHEVRLRAIEDKIGKINMNIAVIKTKLNIPVGEE